MVCQPATLAVMAELLVGYARCSTDSQDLTAQRDTLTSFGVAPDRIYVDHGLTGTNRDRPGLREALAACHEGDTLVVAKLDRLARSLPAMGGRQTHQRRTRRTVRRRPLHRLPRHPAGRRAHRQEDMSMTRTSPRLRCPDRQTV